MSKRSTGVVYTCDICGTDDIRITSALCLAADYDGVRDSPRGIEVSISGFGYVEDIDICIDCKIEALHKSINQCRSMVETKYCTKCQCNNKVKYGVCCHCQTEFKK